MEKPKQQLVRWFIDFVNLKIDDLSFGDRVKLTTELDLALSGILPESYYVELRVHLDQLFADDATATRELMKNDMQAVRELQNVLKRLFESLIRGIDEAFESEGDFVEKSEFERRRRPVAREMKRVIVEARILAPVTYLCPEDEYSEEPSQRGWEKGGLKEGVIAVTVLPHAREHALEYQFLTASNGLPLRAIMRCPECQKWFLHLSRRRKAYCSNPCAARKVRRTRYERMKEQDPASYETERQKGAERARKSYENKVRKENPGAKIARNPRRKAGKEN